MYVSATSTLAHIQFKPAHSVQPPVSAAQPAVSPYSTQDTWTPRLVGDNTIQAQGKNVGLRIIGKTLGLKADYMEASFHDKTPNNPIDIEELDFNLHVKAGVASVSDVDATLTVERLLNRKTEGSTKKPLVKDLRVTFNPNNEVRVEGKVRALGMNLPIDIKGQVSSTAAGEIRYDLGKAKVAGIGLNGLMSVAGLNLDKLLKLHNPNEGYYTQGNSLYVNLGTTVSNLDDAIGLQANVHGVSTHLGRLQLVVGDTPEDAARALREKQQQEPAYVKATAGHAYIDGFFLKEGKLNIYDLTPSTPLGLNVVGAERSIQVKSGFIGISDARFEELIKDEIGETDDFTDIDTTLKKEGAHLKGKLFGAVPVSMNLKFGRTHEGQLMFTPNSPKAIGFIPLPLGLVREKVQKLVKTGTPYGDGVAIKGMSGIDLGYISQLVHQNGYIVMEATEKPQQN
ncbi:MAG: hypothetical protein AB7I41_17050 [Candidatus Sericytochromatia bacterium]